MFNYVSYWENRGWSGGEPEWIDEIFPHIPRGAKTVLDVGCSDGRYAPLFSKMDYTGVDINAGQIAIAKKKCPGCDFYVGDIIDWLDNFQYDLFFSSKFLQHIPPEYIEEVSESLKFRCKNGIMIECVGDGKGLAEHNWHHDYRKLFNVVHEEVLEGPVRLMVHGKK